MKTKKIILVAMIGALYSAITLTLSFMAFGTIQFRIAEGLCVLPAFSILGVWGLTIGCFVSNMVGFFIGANILGAFDMIFGTAATLIAAILTYYLGKLKSKSLKIILIPLPAVIINAIIIGLELMYLLSGGKFDTNIFLVQAGSVFIGQLVCCYLVGVPLFLWLNKYNIFKKLI